MTKFMELSLIRYLNTSIALIRKYGANDTYDGLRLIQWYHTIASKGFRFCADKGMISDQKEVSVVIKESDY
jgi:hypothetical protein